MVEAAWWCSSFDRTSPETAICRRRSRSREKVEGFAWIIAAAYLERADDRTVIGILGCTTDISRQKWMEGFQTRKMMEAVKLKRQQENFIEIKSQ